MSIKFNLSQMKDIYREALCSCDKTMAFDITIGRGRFLFMMFLSEEDKKSKDRLFIYMRNTVVMIDLKMYGSHKNGDFMVYINEDNEEKMKNELQLQQNGRRFEFTIFLNQLNSLIPTSITMKQKVKILRDNRDVIRTIAIDDINKIVLIGTRQLQKRTPKDKTLRKLYMYTNESEAAVTAFIQKLKSVNMTVAWTTEENRYRAAEINSLINTLGS